MSSVLFSPLRMRGVTVANRIALAPMDQFCAKGGLADDWHLMHYGKFAVSGIGLIIGEVTAVTPEAPVTPGDLGLYTDAQEAALARVVGFCKEHGSAVMGIQLGHAGQKASTEVPWRGRGPILPADGGWKTAAPSPVSVLEDWPEPEVLDRAGLARIKAAFVDSALRAERIGYDLIELHGAHGYLLHQFMSPITNHRSDEYGGTPENRIRYPLEVFEAVRRAWPDDKPLGIRVSATDWVEGGWDVPDVVGFARELEALGCDFIHVSSGGISPKQQIEPGPGYQVRFAAAVKAAVNMAVMTVGQINHARQAETILTSRQADMVALGRGMLYDPHWTWHAAAELEEDVPYVKQYARAHPSLQGIRGIAVAGKRPLLATKAQ